MTERLIALDLDGTTITHAGVLRPAVREAVQAVAATGMHIVVATGRSIVATTPILDALGLTTGYVVCSNGAVTLALAPAALAQEPMKLSLREALALAAQKNFDKSDRSQVVL